MDKNTTGLSQARKEETYDFIAYIEELKDRLDIMQVAELRGITVNKHGQAQCFNSHDQKTPSLKFYLDSQSYHCFGCGAHGDAISLVQHLDGCSFIQAVNQLAYEGGVSRFHSNNGFDPERYAMVGECLKAAAEIYHEWLDPTDTYLTTRGINSQTARQFLIGSAKGAANLRPALERKGFPIEISMLSGLVKADGADFFQNHVVVPIINRGSVVDFYGRSLNGDARERHWRLPNDRFKVGSGLFNFNPKTEEIVLVEGIFDALALIQNGFTSAVATFGTQGLKDLSVALFRNSRMRNVFLCYDGDQSGLTAAVRDGFALEDLGKDVRIVNLPENTDPNEFMLVHSRDDLQMLMDSSLSPFDHQIEQIRALGPREECLKRIRDELLPRVMQADPIMQPELVKKIHEKLNIPVKALNEQLKLARGQESDQKKQIEALEVCALTTINPALDFIGDTAVIMTPQRVMDVESRVPRWQNTVVTTGRERFVISHEELIARGWHTPELDRTDIRVAEERYASAAINGFLDGSRSGNINKTFSDIRGAIQRFIDFTDQRVYDFLACWAIGTYLFPIFSHYPYVHFTGPKGSGKSQCLHVLGNLCHNAKIAGSMTLAVQFRIISALQPTLLFDEMENLGQTQHTELHRMLKYGFEKNGPQVWRMDTSGNRMEMSCWSVYCPRAFASIEGMEDVIGSRSVQVIMERSFNEEIKNRTVNSEDPLWLDIRDQLFLVTMTEGIRIKGIYSSLNKPPQISFSGRDWDIFKGILAVAQSISPDTFDSLISFTIDTHEAKVARDQDNSPDMIILKYLSEIVTQLGWYELGQLNDGLTEMVSSQGLDLQGSMFRDRLGKRLSALKAYQETKRGTVNGKKVTLYLMDPEVILKKLENHLRG
jgi:DNA primase catalytic core